MQQKPAPLQPVLQNVLRQAMKLLGARAGSLMFLDECSGELRIAVACGLPQEIVRQVRVGQGEGIAGWVLARSRPRLLRRDERAADSSSPPERLSSAISAPLRVGRRTIGVINISDPEQGDFDPSHVRVLMAFAGQAAAAVENARLYESLQQRMRELGAVFRIGQALTSSLDLSRVLREVLRYAIQNLSARSGSIMLLTADGKELRIASAVGLEREVIRKARLPVGQGIAGAVAQSGEPIVLDQGTVDRRSAGGRGRATASAAMSVPLRVRERVIGVINIRERATGENFSAEDLQFLSTMAGQAAVAIENARLYRRLEQRVSLANRELIHANHLLEHEKQKIQAIVDGMADGVIVVNRMGRVAFLNPTAASLLRLSPKEILGKGLRRWPAGQSLLAVFEEAGRSDGMSVVKEVSLPGAERRDLSVNVTPLRDNRQHAAGFIAVLTDITEAKTLSEMKSELVSFVSHELRSPITCIKGFTDTLRLALDGNEEMAPEMRREFYDIMSRECDRLLLMINEMLDVSRMEAGRRLQLILRPVEIPPLLEGAIASQRVFTSRHEMVIDVADDLPPILADGDKLFQVLINLLNNAIKYSPEGGRVVLAATRRPPDAVRISVSDHGLGIPPEMIGKLFQRYYRVQTKEHRSIKGTGLGLFFVKGVVEAHGGSVWVESQFGKGSRFLFELPTEPPSPLGTTEKPAER